MALYIEYVEVFLGGWGEAQSCNTISNCPLLGVIVYRSYFPITYGSGSGDQMNSFSSGSCLNIRQPRASSRAVRNLVYFVATRTALGYLERYLPVCCF